MALKISVTGQDKAIAALRALAKLAPDKARKEVLASTLRIHADTRQRLPVDTGILRASYKWNTENNGLTGVVYSESKYSIYIEFGTKPHFPPLEPLRAWARRHGMDESAAFPIARKIAERGTPAIPCLFPAYENERQRFENAVELALKQAVQQAAQT